MPGQRPGCSCWSAICYCPHGFLSADTEISPTQGCFFLCGDSGGAKFKLLDKIWSSGASPLSGAISFYLFSFARLPMNLFTAVNFLLPFAYCLKAVPEFLH